MKRAICPDCGGPAESMGNDMYWCERCREEKLILVGATYIVSGTYQPPMGPSIYGYGRGA